MKLAVAPSHILVLPGVIEMVGFGFTVTVILLSLLQPFKSVPIKVYVVLVYPLDSKCNY